MTEYEHLENEWPAWINDILEFAPLAELEVEWRAAIGDAIVRVLEQRRALLNQSPCICTRCSNIVSKDAFSYPYCPLCWANPSCK